MSLIFVTLIMLLRLVIPNLVPVIKFDLLSKFLWLIGDIEVIRRLLNIIKKIGPFARHILSIDGTGFMDELTAPWSKSMFESINITTLIWTLISILKD